jgi:hypothetical protein
MKVVEFIFSSVGKGEISPSEGGDLHEVQGSLCGAGRLILLLAT